MKAAILISGYTRTFEFNFDSLKKKILSKFDDIDVYLHLTRDESNDKYLNKTKNFDELISLLNPVVTIIESNYNFDSNCGNNNLINAWSKFFKLNLIKQEHEKKFGQYDIIIKYRPDMNIISEIDFSIENGYIYIPIDSKIDKSKLSVINDPYICDIFCYGDSQVMDKYFQIYKSINNLISNYSNVPENILYHHLVESQISYKKVDIKYNMILSLCNVFAITGDSGSGKTTLGNILKHYFSNSFILECDRYHKWERNDDNWKSFTHLNPAANFLTKMNEDIFNLRIGNSIYQVDYDHSCGKFTESEKIESSDNIIVCGLHSLYSDDDAVYDIKVFMDVDDDLKTKWKIERDVSKRGYTKNDIIKQIESRKDDYYKFIYPQRNVSDIVVNFFTGDNDCVNLKIFISKKYRIEDILNNLENKEIEFKKKSNDLFYEIVFNSYKECDILNGYSSKSYYDYILFFILSLKQKI